MRLGATELLAGCSLALSVWRLRGPAMTRWPLPATIPTATGQLRTPGACGELVSLCRAMVDCLHSGLLFVHHSVTAGHKFTFHCLREFRHICLYIYSLTARNLYLMIDFWFRAVSRGSQWCRSVPVVAQATGIQGHTVPAVAEDLTKQPGNGPGLLTIQ